MTLLSVQNKAAWVAGAVAAGCFVVAIFPGIWLLRWSVKRDMDRCAAQPPDIQPAAWHACVHVRGMLAKRMCEQY